VTACRLSNNLDNKYPAGNPWDHDDDTLRYEIEKLATVFEALRLQESPEDRRAMIEVLKEAFPSAEVDEIVEEYDLLKRPTKSWQSQSKKDHNFIL
jgi:hypothetical protein